MNLKNIINAKRILVLGSSGSGKTYLSRRLGVILGLDVIYLDIHFWNPDWTPTADDEWRTRVASLVNGEEWVMDGTYERSLDLRLPAADCIFIINSNRIACLWRVFKRTISTHEKYREDAPPGQKLDAAFFRYIWNFPAVSMSLVDSEISKYASKTPKIVLSGLRDISLMLESLENVMSEPATEDMKQ